MTRHCERNGTTEIEITSEMIDAAYDVLDHFVAEGGAYAVTEECLIGIYRAMSLSQPILRRAIPQSG